MEGSIGVPSGLSAHRSPRTGSRVTDRQRFEPSPTVTALLPEPERPLSLIVVAGTVSA
jgi:hypothetical protein